MLYIKGIHVWSTNLEAGIFGFITLTKCAIPDDIVRGKCLSKVCASCMHVCVGVCVRARTVCTWSYFVSLESDLHVASSSLHFAVHGVGHDVPLHDRDALANVGTDNRHVNLVLIFDVVCGGECRWPEQRVHNSSDLVHVFGTLCNNR